MPDIERRVQQMQRRIDQLAVEPWANEAELEDTYDHLLSAYRQKDINDLTPTDICYVLDGQTYQIEQGKELLSEYRYQGELAAWEQESLDIVLGNYQQALED